MKEIEPTYRVFHVDDMPDFIDALANSLSRLSNEEIEIVLYSSVIDEAIELIKNGQLELLGINVTILDSLEGRACEISDVIRERLPTIPILGLTAGDELVYGTDITLSKMRSTIEIIDAIRALRKD